MTSTALEDVVAVDTEEDGEVTMAGEVEGGAVSPTIEASKAYFAIKVISLNINHSESQISMCYRALVIHLVWKINALNEIGRIKTSSSHTLELRCDLEFLREMEFGHDRMISAQALAVVSIFF